MNTRDFYHISVVCNLTLSKSLKIVGGNSLKLEAFDLAYAHALSQMLESGSHEDAH